MQRTKQGNSGDFISLSQRRMEVFERATVDLAASKIPGAKIQSAHRFRIMSIQTLSIADYSVGNDLASVEAGVMKTITAFEEGFKWEGFSKSYGLFDQMVWLVSMAILVDVDQEDFQRITKVIARDKVRDKLLNFLIKFKQPDWTDNSNQFIQKHPYSNLKRAIEETSEEAGVRELKNYLKKEVWYEGHSDASWYESHIRSPKSFFGYWSWEAAALVKAKGWDDEKLKDNEYYPYDAVHW